jgi:CarD family transcriptional regulator
MIVWTLYLPNSAVELGLGFIGIDRIEKTPLELGRLAQFQFRFSGDMWPTGSSKGNRMARKSETAFEEGDFVVYPTHGVGRILGTEERDVDGTTLEMLVVRFEQDRMTLRVPMEKAKSLGLRTLSSKRQMEQAITTLQGKAKVRRTMWSRRAQEYETKIKSGDPVSIAEVVRDLHRRENQSEQSYSERQMYQAALERLAREFAAIEKIDQDVAALRLEDLMDAA